MLPEGRELPFCDPSSGSALPLACLVCVSMSNGAHSSVHAASSPFHDHRCTRHYRPCRCYRTRRVRWRIGKRTFLVGWEVGQYQPAWSTGRFCTWPHCRERCQLFCASLKLVVNFWNTTQRSWTLTNTLSPRCGSCLNITRFASWPTVAYKRHVWLGSCSCQDSCLASRFFRSADQYCTCRATTWSGYGCWCSVRKCCEKRDKTKTNQKTGVKIFKSGPQPCELGMASLG